MAARRIVKGYLITCCTLYFAYILYPAPCTLAYRSQFSRCHLGLPPRCDKAAATAKSCIALHRNTLHCNAMCTYAGAMNHSYCTCIGTPFTAITYISLHRYTLHIAITHIPPAEEHLALQSLTLHQQKCTLHCNHLHCIS